MLRGHRLGSHMTTACSRHIWQGSGSTGRVRICIWACLLFCDFVIQRLFHLIDIWKVEIV